MSSKEKALTVRSNSKSRQCRKVHLQCCLTSPSKRRLGVMRGNGNHKIITPHRHLTCLFIKLYIFTVPPRLVGVGRAIAESISCLLPEMAVATPKILHLSIFGHIRRKPLLEVLHFLFFDCVFCRYKMSDIANAHSSKLLFLSVFFFSFGSDAKVPRHLGYIEILTSFQLQVLHINICLLQSDGSSMNSTIHRIWWQLMRPSKRKLHLPCLNRPDRLCRFLCA